MLLFWLTCHFVVSVAQLVELWIVAPAAGGSNPLAHPNFTFWLQKRFPKKLQYLRGKITYNWSARQRVRYGWPPLKTQLTERRKKVEKAR